MNDVLYSLDSLEADRFSHEMSLYDYLVGMGFSDEILAMASAGYANTLCSNIKELSLRQCILWSKLWNAEVFLKVLFIPYQFKDWFADIHVSSHLSLFPSSSLSSLLYQEMASGEAGTAEGEGDYVFDDSYKVLLDHLQDKVQVELGTPVSLIAYPEMKGTFHSLLVS